MAQSHLPKERIVAVYPSMANLRSRMGDENPRNWGLLQSGQCVRFGPKVSAWNLELSFAQMYAGALEEYPGFDEKEIVLFYGLNMKTQKIQAGLLNLANAEIYGPGIQVPKIRIVHH